MPKSLGESIRHDRAVAIEEAVAGTAELSRPDLRLSQSSHVGNKIEIEIGIEIAIEIAIEIEILPGTATAANRAPWPQGAEAMLSTTEILRRTESIPIGRCRFARHDVPDVCGGPE